MFSLIQFFAIVLFLVSFVLPFLWIIGHGFAILLFVMASIGSRICKRPKCR